MSTATEENAAVPEPEEGVPTAIEKRDDQIQLLLHDVREETEFEEESAEIYWRNQAARRLRIGEALRANGLDEKKVAQIYTGVLDALMTRKSSSAVEKLLVDVLKECTRLLEPPQKSENRPSRIRLVHRVPRPKRK